MNGARSSQRDHGGTESGEAGVHDEVRAVVAGRGEHLHGDQRSEQCHRHQVGDALDNRGAPAPSAARRARPA
jgi:hypothetical protein